MIATGLLLGAKAAPSKKVPPQPMMLQTCTCTNIEEHVMNTRFSTTITALPGGETHSPDQRRTRSGNKNTTPPPWTDNNAHRLVFALPITYEQKRDMICFTHKVHTL